MSKSISYVTQKVAAQIDVDLMSSDMGFVTETLMELAGLSCAQAIADVYSKTHHSKVLVVLGPGNNGGDGLICARHLHHFGYRVECVYPKQRGIAPYAGFKKQCEWLDIPFYLELPLNVDANYNLIVDAIFGYSFAIDSDNGEIREPFQSIIKSLSQSTLPIASLDVPSGWDVNTGEDLGVIPGIRPNFLISLGIPKLCAKKFLGEFHYFGGRFSPGKFLEKYDIALPQFESSEMYTRIHD